MTPAQQAGDKLTAIALLGVGGRAIKVAALEYAHEVLKEIRLLDHGEFHHTLDSILGTIITTAKNAALKEARLP